MTLKGTAGHLRRNEQSANRAQPFENCELVGGLGVSGDTACADHVIAWKTRHSLGLDAVPMGVAPGTSDNLIFDIQNGVSSSGFGHPDCKGGNPSKSIIEQLNQKLPVGPK
jgi:hypothetical protein